MSHLCLRGEPHKRKHLRFTCSDVHTTSSLWHREPWLFLIFQVSHYGKAHVGVTPNDHDSLDDPLWTLDAQTFHDHRWCLGCSFEKRLQSSSSQEAQEAAPETDSTSHFKYWVGKLLRSGKRKKGWLLQTRNPSRSSAKTRSVQVLLRAGGGGAKPAVYFSKTNKCTGM